MEGRFYWNSSDLDPSKSLNKLIELLDDIPNGIVKEEIEECIRRIRNKSCFSLLLELRLEGDASLKETSKLVYDALVEERMITKQQLF